jgi:hypothetical protein
MSEIIDVIDLTDTSRLVVEPDTDAECPRGDWHMLTGFVKINGRGDSRLADVPAVHPDPIGIVAHHDDFVWDKGFSENVVERYARIFHNLHIEYDAEHGGYWFVAGADAFTAATPVNKSSRALFYENWPSLKIGTSEHLTKQAEVIEQERETYRQWAEGEVYGVILERRRTFVKQYADGDEVEGEEWEQADALWGCYLDDEYTPFDVASEHFSLTDEERTEVDEQSRVAKILKK